MSEIPHSSHVSASVAATTGDPQLTQAHHAHEPHAGDAHDVSQHLKLYFMVGGVLFLGTALTVGLSYVNFGSSHINIAVALLVATLKAGTVAAIFMHLKGEKSTIWKFLIFTSFFCAALFFLSYLQWIDPIFQTNHSQH